MTSLPHTQPETHETYPSHSHPRRHRDHRDEAAPTTARLLVHLRRHNDPRDHADPDPSDPHRTVGDAHNRLPDGAELPGRRTATVPSPTRFLRGDGLQLRSARPNHPTRSPHCPEEPSHHGDHSHPGRDSLLDSLQPSPMARTGPVPPERRRASRLLHAGDPVPGNTSSRSHPRHDLYPHHPPGSERTQSQRPSKRDRQGRISPAAGPPQL